MRSNLLVLTVNRLFMVMTIGPKGSPDDAAKRFLRSFRLVTPDAAPTAASPSVNASSNPVAAKLAAPMLAVARLITEQKLNPRIEDVVQHAPPAARLTGTGPPSSWAICYASTRIAGKREPHCSPISSDGRSGCSSVRSSKSFKPKSVGIRRKC